MALGGSCSLERQPSRLSGVQPKRRGTSFGVPRQPLVTRFGARHLDATIARAPCTRLSGSVFSSLSMRARVRRRVKRRAFIALIGGAVICPRSTTAQQHSKVYSIAIFSAAPRNSTPHLEAAFFEAL